MARIFITGSADGLGLLAAKALVDLGHHVVLHARHAERGKQALEKAKGAAEALIADLSSMEETKALASKVNALGKFDAVIHNAGIYQASGTNAEGLPLLFTVNSLAPYILTCLIERPERLIYLSSDMHLQADPALTNLSADQKSMKLSYSDTKFHDLILCKAVADKWKDVYSNAVHPGWVPTKMGGAGAPDDLNKGFQTQVWLAESNDPQTCVSGHYFYHKKQARYLESADQKTIREKFLAVCERITGLRLDD